MSIFQRVASGAMRRQPSQHYSLESADAVGSKHMKKKASVFGGFRSAGMGKSSDLAATGRQESTVLDPQFFDAAAEAQDASGGRTRAPMLGATTKEISFMVPAKARGHDSIDLGETTGSMASTLATLSEDGGGGGSIVRGAGTGQDDEWHEGEDGETCV